MTVLNELPQRCGKQAHLRRGNSIPRHDYGIRRNLGHSRREFSFPCRRLAVRLCGPVAERNLWICGSLSQSSPSSRSRKTGMNSGSFAASRNGNSTTICRQEIFCRLFFLGELYELIREGNWQTESWKRICEAVPVVKMFHGIHRRACQKS